MFIVLISVKSCVVQVIVCSSSCRGFIMNLANKTGALGTHWDKLPSMYALLFPDEAGTMQDITNKLQPRSLKLEGLTNVVSDAKGWASWSTLDTRVRLNTGYDQNSFSITMNILIVGVRTLTTPAAWGFVLLDTFLGSDGVTICNALLQCLPSIESRILATSTLRVSEFIEPWPRCSTWRAQSKTVGTGEPSHGHASGGCEIWVIDWFPDWYLSFWWRWTSIRVEKRHDHALTY